MNPEFPTINCFQYETFYVGGYVRDRFLGENSKDLDIVICAPSFEAMEQEIINAGGKIFQSRPEFLVTRANVPGLGAVDCALPRVDGVYDGRRPDETFIAESIESDLSRRDARINAIAVNVKTGEIVDPFSGIEDIENRIIGMVGNPFDRFNEDFLRCYRIARFAITKGFHVNYETANAIKSITDIKSFEKVSTDRIRDEVYKMFAHDTREAMYYLFDMFDILGRVMLASGIWLKPTTEKP